MLKKSKGAKTTPTFFSKITQQKTHIKKKYHEITLVLKNDITHDVKSGLLFKIENELKTGSRDQKN